MSAGARLAVALCILAGAAGLVACGEEQSDEDYVTSVNDVAASFGQGAQELADKVTKIDSLPAAADALDTFSARAADLASELDDINPPDAVADLNDRLVELLENLAGKAQQAALTLKAGDIIGGFPALAKIATESVDVGVKIDSTVDEIKGKLGVGD